MSDTLIDFLYYIGVPAGLVLTVLVFYCTGTIDPAEPRTVYVKIKEEDVAKLAEVIRSKEQIRGECMKKEVKHYENLAGKVILAYAGLSRPYHENEPFVEGYWVLTDSYGSEQFIPKIPFEREYWEVKTPSV